MNVIWKIHIEKRVPFFGVILYNEIYFYKNFLIYYRSKLVFKILAILCNFFR